MRIKSKRKCTRFNAALLPPRPPPMQFTCPFYNFFRTRNSRATYTNRGGALVLEFIFFEEMRTGKFLSPPPPPLWRIRFAINPCAETRRILVTKIFNTPRANPFGEHRNVKRKKYGTTAVRRACYMPSRRAIIRRSPPPSSVTYRRRDRS